MINLRCGAHRLLFLTCSPWTKDNCILCLKDSSRMTLSIGGGPQVLPVAGQLRLHELCNLFFSFSSFKDSGATPSSQPDSVAIWSLVTRRCLSCALELDNRFLTGCSTSVENIWRRVRVPYQTKLVNWKAVSLLSPVGIEAACVSVQEQQTVYRSGFRCPKAVEDTVVVIY